MWQRKRIIQLIFLIIVIKILLFSIFFFYTNSSQIQEPELPKKEQILLPPTPLKLPVKEEVVADENTTDDIVLDKEIIMIKEMKEKISIVEIQAPVIEQKITEKKQVFEDVQEMLGDDKKLNLKEVEEISFLYTKEEENIKNELEKRMNNLYLELHKQRTKKALVSSLKKKKEKSFLSDYNGNTYYGNNTIADKDGRSILLEQIQKVRKRGSGFIISKVKGTNKKRYIFVKDLARSDLFIGVELYKEY